MKEWVKVEVFADDGTRIERNFEADMYCDAAHRKALAIARERGISLPADIRVNGTSFTLTQRGMQLADLHARDRSKLL